MQARLEWLASLVWPGLEALPQPRRQNGIGDVLSVLFTTPIAAFGMIWLAALTEIQVFIENRSLLLLAAAALWLLWRLPFFLTFELASEYQASAESTLAGIVGWMAVLAVGPEGLWLLVFAEIIHFASKIIKSSSRSESWSILRNTSVNMAAATAIPLAALTLYRRLGGSIPLQELGAQSAALVLVALLLNLAGQLLVLSIFVAYHAWQRTITEGPAGRRLFLKFFLLSIALTHLPYPFAILGVWLQAASGLAGFGFFALAIVLMAVVTRRLSLAAESSRQQSHLLRELQNLGRDIILAPGREQDLHDLLATHLPTMFPAGNLAIWTIPDRMLYKHPPSWRPDFGPINPWLLKEDGASHFLAHESLPWSQAGAHNPLIIAPILEVEQEKPYGGILLELHTGAEAWDRTSAERISTGVQSLSALISSALHQQRAITELKALQRVSQQLEDAAIIQASFLDYELPKIPGWELSVTLLPADQTSGDFFDVFELEDGRVGIIIADVMDKGLGAALYMALSRTLLRTYASETNGEPELVFFATNQRILEDTNVRMFVTAFYGVLDPQSGVLTYCNAGHHPPLLLRQQESVITRELIRTGIPIGINEAATWDPVSLQLHAGDLLVLYTDGIPDAQNGREERMTIRPVIEAAKTNLGRSAEEVQSAILQTVHNYMDGARQYDDITLIVIAPETTGVSSSVAH